MPFVHSRCGIVSAVLRMGEQCLERKKRSEHCKSDLAGWAGKLPFPHTTTLRSGPRPPLRDTFFSFPLCVPCGSLSVGTEASVSAHFFLLTRCGCFFISTQQLLQRGKSQGSLGDFFLSRQGSGKRGNIPVSSGVIPILASSARPAKSVSWRAVQERR